MGRTSVVSLVGNPRPSSRTARAATHLATAIAGHLDAGAEAPVLVDLADLGPAVLDPESGPARAAVESVAAAEVLVVASPVYKGSYTGLLKAFLDRYGPGGLDGVVAVPLMVGASPGHGHAPEVHLRPVLLELGAWCPTPALYLQEQGLGALGTADCPAQAWAARHAPPLTAWLTAGATALAS